MRSDKARRLVAERGPSEACSDRETNSREAPILGGLDRFAGGMDRLLVTVASIVTLYTWGKYTYHVRMEG